MSTTISRISVAKMPKRKVTVSKISGVRNNPIKMLQQMPESLSYAQQDYNMQDIRQPSYTRSNIDVATSLKDVISNPNVRRIELDYLKSSDIELLIKAIPNTKARELMISKSDSLADKDLKALSNAIGLSQLKEVVFHDLGIDDDKLTIIANELTKQANQIQYLVLDKNKITESGSAAIALLLKMQSLESLSLNQNFIGDQGLGDVGLALQKSNVKTLSLGNNRISDTGAASLAAGLAESKLTVLHLNDNLIEDKGIKAIGEGMIFSKTEILNLNSNRISDDGFVPFLADVSKTALNRIYVNDNDIEDKGAIALSKLLMERPIVGVYLNKNKVTDKGAFALAKVLPDTKLQVLSMTTNKLRPKGIKTLDRASRIASNLQAIYVN